MKYLFTTLLFIFTSFIWSEGLDLGLITDNQTVLNISDTWGASQRNTQRLWASFDTSSFKIKIQGRFTTSFGLPDPMLDMDPELELFKLQWTTNYQSEDFNSSDIQIGRINMRDPANLIYSGTLDGFLLGLGGKTWGTRMGFGYNGFLSKKSSQLVLTNSDLTDQANMAIFFAAPRAVGLLEGSLILSETHKLSFSYLPQLDLRELVNGTGRIIVKDGDTSENSVEGGILNTHYGLLDLSGTLVTGLYYDVAAAVSTGQSLYYSVASGVYKSSWILGSAATASLDWFLKDNLKSNLHIQGWYTSGDDANRQDYKEGSKFSKDPAFLSIFRTLSNTAPGYVFAPQFGNMAIAELSYNMRVLASARSQDGLTAGLTGRSFMRITEGPVSSTRVNLGEGGTYLGTEGILSLRYRPLSDLSISLTTGVFFPNISSGGAFISTTSSIEYKTALYFSLSL